MPVKPESRFAGLPLLKVNSPDGGSRTVISLRLERPTTPRGIRHRLMQGEGLDLLARRYLGDERLWWRILDANPLIHPLELEPGMILEIPAPGPATRTVRTRSF